jgi:hypothetical protein
MSAMHCPDCGRDFCSCDSWLETVERLTTELAQARVEVERLHEEVEESDAVRTRMADLLTRTANALKGDPPPLTQHDWSDLPEVAARIVGGVGPGDPADCPASHGAQCCGYPGICRANLEINARL